MAKNAPIKQVLERPNLRDHIYEILKKEIILRKIKPGEKINEEELAKSLQVSRTPVRETLLRLEHEGIVEIIPRRGAFVVSQSKQKVMDILQVREVLEGLVARLATENMDERILNRLRNCLKKISSTKNDEDMLLKYPAADVEFHSLLRAKQTVKEHYEILGAIEKGSAPSAESMMRKHVESVREDALKNIDLME
jgi:DNA-binding GntR family transcriptional regulator